MKNNICIIDTSSGITGAFVSGKVLAEALSDDYNVLYFVPVTSSLLLQPEQFKLNLLGYRYFGLRKKLFNLIMFLPYLILNTSSLKKTLKDNNVSVLIVNDFNNLTGVMLKLLGWKGKVFTYVRLIPSSLPKLLSSLYLYLADKFTDGKIAVSNTVFKELKSKTNSICIHNCLDTSVISDVNIVVNDELSVDGINFVYLGNYMPGKGQYEALTAFNKVACSRTNVTLTFYGGDLGLQKNADFKSKLESLVNELGLGGVVFFNGFISSPEAILPSYDVLLNFSKSESFSRTCLEASSCGLAVIATKCGGPEEIVIDHKTGFLVDIDDILAMRDAMLIFSDEPLLAKKYGVNGKKHVTHKFSYAKYKRKINAFILELS